MFACILPEKAVPEITYIVSGGTLNPTHSLTHSLEGLLSWPWSLSWLSQLVPCSHRCNLHVKALCQIFNNVFYRFSVEA